MILAIELRIGNWILKYDLKGGFQKRIVTSGYLKCVVEDYARCEPIPLTPELLKQCGFVDGCLEVARGLTYGYLKSDMPNGSVIYRLNGIGISYPCKYLHELQNLYFALVRKELQITL